MNAPSFPRIDDRLLRGASWLPMACEPGSSFSFRQIQTRAFPFPFHYHPEIELTYVARGSGRRIVGEKVRRFQDGDLVLLGSMLPHVWLSDPKCAATEAYVLRFHRSIVEDHLLVLPECEAALRWIRRAERGLEWQGSLPPGLDRLVRNLLQAPTPGKRLVGFLDLILSLAAERRWRTICGDFPKALGAGSTDQRIGYAVRYLREHYAGEVVQARVARQVGMETAAFSRLFRRTTGQTFQGMLVNLRVDHARRLLAATRMSITEICFASGFQNLSNFNKQFLAATKLPPRRYRKTAHEEQSERGHEPSAIRRRD